MRKGSEVINVGGRDDSSCGVEREHDGVICQVPEEGAGWPAHAKPSGQHTPAGKCAGDNTAY
eukprot:15684023-Heterocapsa_arctica.AAC.1